MMRNVPPVHEAYLHEFEWSAPSRGSSPALASLGLLAVLCMLPGLLSAQQAPESRVIRACYHRSTGTVYRIGEPGLPQECRGASSVPFTWTDAGSPTPDAVGTQWFASDGPPSKASGADGDFHLDLVTGDLYRRDEGKWLLHGSLLGPEVRKDPRVRRVLTVREAKPGQRVHREPRARRAQKARRARLDRRVRRDLRVSRGPKVRRARPGPRVRRDPRVRLVRQVRKVRRARRGHRACQGKRVRRAILANPVRRGCPDS